MQDVERFLASLPSMGIAPEFVPAYRTALASVARWVERSGKPSLDDADVPALLRAARDRGAQAQQLKNLETVCRSYLAWRATAASSDAPQPVAASVVPPRVAQGSPLAARRAGDARAATGSGGPDVRRAGQASSRRADLPLHAPHARRAGIALGSDRKTATA